MLVCRICGETTEYMWKCIPRFRAGDPVSHALCSKCMATALSWAYRIFSRDMKQETEENGRVQELEPQKFFGGNVHVG